MVAQGCEAAGERGVTANGFVVFFLGVVKCSKVDCGEDCTAPCIR